MTPAATTGFKRTMLQALLQTLRARNGDPLWDGSSPHCVCPLHGTGNNHAQCSLDLDRGVCTCWGDCASDGKPRRITLADIAKDRVIAAGSWSKFAPYLDTIQRTKDGRPIIIRSARRPVAEVAHDIGAQLAKTGAHYRLGRQLAEIRNGNVQILDKASEIAGAIHTNLEIAVRRRFGLQFRTLTSHDALVFSCMAPFREELPAIEFIAHGPAFDRDVQLVSPGYNARSKIFSVSESVEPRARATHLTKFLDEVSFRDQASRANYVALLLTGLFPQHWLGARPMGWIDANQSVVGKTMLAQCCAAIVSGGDVGTIRFSPEEAALGGDHGKKTSTRLARGLLASLPPGSKRASVASAMALRAKNSSLQHRISRANSSST